MPIRKYIAEFLGTFILTLAVGFSLAAGAGSNGVLNPAVALGIGSFSLGYLIGPVIGAVLAMQLYRYLADER